MADRIVLPSGSLTVDDFFFTKGTQAKRLLSFINHLSLGYMETCNAIVKQMHVRTSNYRQEQLNKSQNGPSTRTSPQQNSKHHPEWYKIDTALLPVFQSLLTSLEVRSLTGIADWGLCDVDGNPLPVPPITSHFRIAASPLVPSAEAAAFNLLIGTHNAHVVIESNSSGEDAVSSRKISLSNTLTHARFSSEGDEADDLNRRQLPVLISTLVRAVTNCINLSPSTSSTDELDKLRQIEAGHRAVLSSLTNFILDHDADSLGTLDFSRFAAIAIYLHLAHVGNATDEKETMAELNLCWYSSLQLLSLLWTFTKSFVSDKSFSDFVNQLTQTDRSHYETKALSVEDTANKVSASVAKSEGNLNSELITMMPPLRLCALLISVFGNKNMKKQTTTTGSQNDEVTLNNKESEPFTIREEIFTLKCPMNDTATIEDINFVRTLLRSSAPETQVYADQLDHIRFVSPEQCPFSELQNGKVLGDVDLIRKERITKLENDTWKFFTATNLQPLEGEVDTYVKTLLAQPEDVFSLLMVHVRKHVLVLATQEVSENIRVSKNVTSAATESLQPIFPFLKKLLDLPRNHHLRPFVCHQLYFSPTDSELRIALFEGPLGAISEVNGKRIRAPLTLEDHTIIVDYLSGDFFSNVLSVDNEKQTAKGKGISHKHNNDDPDTETDKMLSIAFPKGVSSFVTHPCYGMHNILQHYLRIAEIVQKTGHSKTTAKDNGGQQRESENKGLNAGEKMLEQLLATNGNILDSILNVVKDEEPTPDLEKKRLTLLQQIAQYVTSLLSTTKGTAAMDDEKNAKSKEKDISNVSPQPTLFLLPPNYLALLAQQLSFLRAIQLLQSVSKFITQKSEQLSNSSGTQGTSSKRSDEPSIDPKQWKDIAAAFSDALTLVTKHSLGNAVSEPNSQSEDHENKNTSLASIVVELILAVATDQILLPALQLKHQLSLEGASLGPLVEEAMQLYCSIINEMEVQLHQCITPRVLSVLRIVIFRARQLVEQSVTISSPSDDTKGGLVIPSTFTGLGSWDIRAGGQDKVSAERPTPPVSENSASPEQLLLNAFSASPFSMLVDTLVPKKDYDRAFKILTHLFSEGTKSESQKGHEIRSDSVLLFAFMTCQLDNLRREFITLESFIDTLDNVTDLLLTNKSERSLIVDESPSLVCRPDLWLHSPISTQSLMASLVEDLNSDKELKKSSLFYVLQQILASTEASSSDSPEAENEEAGAILPFSQFASIYIQPHVTKSSLQSILSALVRAQRTASATSTTVTDFIDSIGIISQSVQAASRGFVALSTGADKFAHADPTHVWKPAFIDAAENSPNYLLDVATHLSHLANTIAAIKSESSAAFTPSVENVLQKAHNLIFENAKEGALLVEEVVTSLLTATDVISPNQFLSILVSEYISTQLSPDNTSRPLTLGEEVNVLRTIELVIIEVKKLREISSPSEGENKVLAPPPEPSFVPLLLVSVSKHNVDFLAIFASKLAMKDDEIELLSNRSITSPLQRANTETARSDDIMSNIAQNGLFRTYEAESAMLLLMLGMQRGLAVGMFIQKWSSLPSTFSALIPSPLANSAATLLDWTKIISADSLTTNGYRLPDLRNYIAFYNIVDDSLDTQSATLKLAHIIAISVSELVRNTHRTPSAYSLTEYLFSIFEFIELSFVQATVMSMLHHCDFDSEYEGGDPSGENSKYSRWPVLAIPCSQFAECIINVLIAGFERVSCRSATKDGSSSSSFVASFFSSLEKTDTDSSTNASNETSNSPTTTLNVLTSAIFNPNQVSEISSAFINSLMNCIDELHYRCKLIIPTTLANANAYLRFISAVPYSTQLGCLESTITAFYAERQRLSDDENDLAGDETIEEFLEALHSRTSDIKRALNVLGHLKTIVGSQSGQDKTAYALLRDPIPCNLLADPQQGDNIAALIPELIVSILRASGYTSEGNNTLVSDGPDSQKKQLSGESIPFPSPKAISESSQLQRSIKLMAEYLLLIRLSLPSSLFGSNSFANVDQILVPSNLATLATPSSPLQSTASSVSVSIILRQVAQICARLWWLLIQVNIPQICQQEFSKKFVLASSEENKSQRRRELKLLEKINAVVNLEFTVRNAQGRNKLSFVSLYKSLTSLCENRHHPNYESSNGMPSSGHNNLSHSPESPHTNVNSLPFTCVAWELVDLITTSDHVKIETQYRLVQYLTNSTTLRPIFIIDQHWDKTILGLDMMRALKERQVKEKELVQLYKKACEEKKSASSSAGGAYNDEEDEDDNDEDDEDDDEEETIDSVFGRTFASEPLLLVENLLMCQRIADVAAILPLIQNGREKECDRLLLKYAYKAVDISPYEKIPMNEFPNGKKISTGTKGGSVTLPLKPPKLKCWIPADATPEAQDRVRKSFSHANTPNMPLYRQIVRICFDQEAAMEASFSFAERLFNALGDYQNNVTKVVIIDTAEHVLMSLPHRTERHVRLLRMFQISRHLVVCNWPDHPQQEVFDSQDEVMNLITKLLNAEHTKAAFSIAEVCGVDIGGVQTLWTDRVRQLLELGLFPEAEAAMAHLAAEKVKEMIAYIKNSLLITPVVSGYRAQRNIGVSSSSSMGGTRGGNSQKYCVKLISDADVPNILSTMRNGIASLFKKYGTRMDLLEFYMQIREYSLAIGIALECRKDFENEVAEIFVRQSFFTNAMGELRRAMKEKDSTLASLRPLIVLCCKTLEKDAYVEELYIWQKWMHDYARAAHTATVLSKQEVRYAEKLALLKEAEKYFMDAKTQPSLKLPDPPFADDGVELPISRLTPQQLHFSLIQVRLQQQLVTALNANNLNCNSLCLYGDYSKVGEVAQSLLVMGKQPLIELAVTIMDSFHVDVMTTMTRATISLLEDKKYEPIEILIEQMKRILSLTPAERNGVLYSMLKVCFDDTSKKAQKLALQCFTAMSNEGGRRVLSLILFGKYQQAMNEAIESKDYSSVESVYENVNKISPLTPELQEIVDQTRQWLTRNRR